MTWWRIDPAAEAVIQSLKNEPERWFESDKSLWLDSSEKYYSLLRLWGYESSGRMDFEFPNLTINRRSQRALWAAFEAWRLTRGQNREQEKRAQIADALERRAP